MTDRTSAAEDSSSLDLVLDEVIAEIGQRVRAGQRVDIEQYAQRFPGREQQIRQLLPAMQALAALGHSSVGDGDAEDVELPAHPVALGDFRILRPLGRGGMGVVYEAEQLSLGRRVALKVLPFAALLNEHQLHRFQTEATAAARLQHPHIVPVYTVGCERGIHYYAMQLIDGPSLAEVIAELRRRRLSDDQSTAHAGPDASDTVVDAANALTRDGEGEEHYRGMARIGREAAEALHYAHENSVVHRDIKPSNLLLDAAGHVWITDFGLARVEDGSQLTRTGDVLGTLRYMSPEQAAGQHDKVDARSDVYSLGATLYELATLQNALDDPTRHRAVKPSLAGSPALPHHIDRRIPRPFSLIINKALARRPVDRYQSAQELAADLQRFLSGDRVHAQQLGWLRRTCEWSRRHWLASAAIIGLLIVALATTTLMHSSFSQPILTDSQSKGEDVKPSTAAKVAGVAVAISMLTTETGLAGKPGQTPLPNLRYRIKYVELPGGYLPNPWINAINEDGCVVGYYNRTDAGGARHAFLYDPSVSQVSARDLHALLTPTIPAGCTLLSATDVSDFRVVVGYFQDSVGNRQGFAVDFGTETPVVDLMPKLGSTDAPAVRINENGDILVAYKNASGGWASYLFNPGYYNGDPEIRASRNGVPLDFSTVLPSDERLTLLPLSGESVYFQLNNPFLGRSAQIAGKTPDGVAFRYTVGGLYEVFAGAKLSSQVSALIDDGTFCGPAYFKNDIDPIRCGSAIERLATAENNPYPGAMNESRDVVTNRQVYRDDWSGWIALDSLVVGSSTDLARWSAAYPNRFHITNRNVATNAGIIVGLRNGLVILTPEPAK